LEEDLKPYDCKIDTGHDNTDDVGAFEGQPPLVQVHYTGDKVTPYYNAKAIYDTAQ